MINLKNADPTFKWEIAKQEGGKQILKCFGCSDCAASCPVRYFDERYNPRKIIRLTLLGMKDQVLSSPFLWFCAHCHACTEHCPQGIPVAELINAIKNYAVENGYCPEGYKIQVELLQKMGRLYEVEDFDLKKRQKIGLPPVDKTIPEVAKILEKTGILNKVGK
ncbi:MAG TPA: 4Fe-4S dicluster domain-containing protein [candidate division WOR-3 bacterium]|uniref:4Fe-4S dicluster domain-containing protein n=1 Tax=candidate division WOR-3 bacterium TaxID=2052148 RepID=A0A9C9ELM4_UNCW3|nr:4Fe-4S dicluster domain-containing protein [candidate division WOR-3 bacterium]